MISDDDAEPGCTPGRAALTTGRSPIRTGPCDRKVQRDRHSGAPALKVFQYSR
ncbi:hypothetical protein ACNFH5_17635 [Pseudomonas sp. NY15435]|uniref:hypothetical protein n=1 Tax=Pseudomonas sp. NY15435 TaxID=3400358 RepID=UPI003A8B5324